MDKPPTEVNYSNLPTISLADKLRLAASKGQLDKVEELLRLKATFETDRDRRTALHYAALNGYPEICRRLISHGCDIDKQDAIGFTALHRACSQGYTGVCKVLLEEGCTKDLQDEHGNMALHEACWNGYSKTVDILVKNNCKVSIQNKSGFTPLHMAAQNGHNESSRILIYSGCSTDIKNNYGDTALHTAARYGHAGVTRILISARCSLTDENKNGDTSLHIAAALKRRKIAKLLVEAGIDCSLRNKQNETASDVARRKEYPEIILIISANYKGKARPHQVHPEDKQAVHIAVDGPNMTFRAVAPTAANKETAKPEKERRFFFFKRKKKDKDRGPDPEHPQPTTSRPQQQQQQPQRFQTPHQGNKSNPVQGFFNKYVPKEGFQYYRDLAGNIKEGPIGYTPICQCMPIVKRIEKNMVETKENLYDHIDASHQILQSRINQLDKRTSQQVFSIDRLNKERMNASHHDCKQHIDAQINQQRKDVERLYSKYNNNVKSELQAWLDTRLTDEESCHPHHHDDSGFYHRSVFFDVVENENGRLFRSRSDETLSQSDYSVRHRKKDFYENRQAAMQQMRAWQTPDRYRRRDNYPARDIPLRQLPNVSVRNTVSVQPGPCITRPHTMMECTSPNRTSSFVVPTSAVTQLSLESLQNPKTFDNREVRPFTSSKLRHPTFPSKTYTPNLPSSSSQDFAPGHSGTLKHQGQVMSQLNHSSLNQKDERQNLVERGPPGVSKRIGPESGPNVSTSNQPTLRQFNENSMENDSKEPVRNQRQLLTVSSYSVTKTSETQLLKTKQFGPKSPAAKLNRMSTTPISNEVYSGMRPRSHSQDLITDSSARDIIHEKKSIGYYHSERTMPLDRSKSYGNLKDGFSGTKPNNSVTLQSNTAMMSQYSHHQSYTVPTTFNTAPLSNSAYSNSVNNTKYTRPSVADSAGKSYANETMQSLQKDVALSNSGQSVCKEQYQKQIQKVLSQTSLDHRYPYKNPALEHTSPYKNPALEPTSPYKNSALECTPPNKNSALEPTSPYKNSTLERTPPYKNPALEHTSPYKNSALERTPPNKNPALEHTSPYKNSALERTPPYKNPSLEHTPPYKNPALEPTSPYKNPTLERTPPYKNPALEPTSPYKNPTLEHTPPYKNPALEHTSPYKNPTLEHTPPYKNPALEHAPPYKNPALSYHSNNKIMLGNQQMSNPNPNDPVKPLSRSEPQLMKSDSSDGHPYINSPTAVSSSIVTAPTNNNTSAAGHIQTNTHQSHWPSSPQQKSNPKLASPMLDWCHKEDSSSNPDSGYSCRIYGNGNFDRSNRGSTLLNISHSNTATPTSSFSGTDQSPSAASVSLQVSPYRGQQQNQTDRGQQQNQADRGSYEDRQPTNKQYFESVTAHLQSWYSKKKMETSHNEVPKTLSPTLLPQNQQQMAPFSAATNPYLAATNCPTSPIKSYIRGSDV